MTRFSRLLLLGLWVSCGAGARAAEGAGSPYPHPGAPAIGCDIAGFIELPGTDICFRASGYAGFYAGAASDTVTGLGSRPSYGWDNVAADTVHTRGDTFVMHAQARLGLDARAATEYGTLRAFVEIQAEDAGASTGGAFGLRHAFIQFGGWTFGKTTRLTAHPPAVPAATEFFGFLADPYRRLVQLRYTRSLGGGLTLAVALEDPAYAQRGEYAANWLSARANAGGAPVAVPVTGVAERDEVPAVVAALTLEGEWGSAKLAGGLRRNVYALPGSAADRAMGWRVDAAANIALAEKLDLLAMAYYADGFNAHSALGLGDVIWRTGAPGGIAGTVEEWLAMLGAAWAIRPDLRATIAVAYAESRPRTTFGTALAATPSGDARTRVFQMLGSLFWEPVPKIEIGMDIGYTAVGYGAHAGGRVEAGAVSVAFQAIRKF